MTWGCTNTVKERGRGEGRTKTKPFSCSDELFLGQREKGKKREMNEPGREVGRVRQRASCTGLRLAVVFLVLHLQSL